MRCVVVENKYLNLSTRRQLTEAVESGQRRATGCCYMCSSATKTAMCGEIFRHPCWKQGRVGKKGGIWAMQWREARRADAPSWHLSVQTTELEETNNRVVKNKIILIDRYTFEVVSHQSLNIRETKQRGSKNHNKNCIDTFSEELGYTMIKPTGLIYLYVLVMYKL